MMITNAEEFNQLSKLSSLVSKHYIGMFTRSKMAGRTGGFSWTATLVLLLAASPFLLDHIFRRAYPVHVKGAVVVTGASTGIGKHAAVTLAQEGYVVFAGVRKEKDADNLKSVGLANLRPVILDVTVQDTIDSTYDTVVSTMEEERLLCVGLVNNAGIGSSGPVEFADEEHVRSVFEVNYYGVLRTTQKFLGLLKQSKGRIINVSSVAGKVTGPLTTTYCATKHALESLSDGLRMEMSLYDVSVSVIEPAYVTSEIFYKDPEPDPRAIAGYAPFYGVSERKTRYIEKASPPTVTSEAILHALRDPHPLTRYVVANVNGVPAKLILKLMWLLPDRAKDALALGVASGEKK